MVTGVGLRQQTRKWPNSSSRCCSQRHTVAVPGAAASVTAGNGGNRRGKRKLLLCRETNFQKFTYYSRSQSPKAIKQGHTSRPPGQNAQECKLRLHMPKVQTSSELSLKWSQALKLMRSVLFRIVNSTPRSADMQCQREQDEACWGTFYSYKNGTCITNAASPQQTLLPTHMKICLHIRSCLPQ